MKRLLIALLALPCLGQAAQPELAATVFEVRPVAKRYLADQSPASLKVGNQLWNGDRLQTQASGLVKLVLADGSVMKVAGGSDLVLDQGPGSSGALVKLAKGLLNIVASKQGPRSLKVSTTNAVAGVKGTQFQVQAEGERTEVQVLEGSVELAPRQGGAPALVQAGQAGVSYADRLEAVRQLNAQEVRVLRAAFRDLVDQKKKDYLKLVRETQQRNKPGAKP